MNQIENSKRIRKTQKGAEELQKIQKTENNLKYSGKIESAHKEQFRKAQKKIKKLKHTEKD